MPGLHRHDNIVDHRPCYQNSGHAIHLSPLTQGDHTTLMQADAARILVTNNTCTADLDGRTANFLMAQGMQVMDYGTPPDGLNRLY